MKPEELPLATKTCEVTFTWPTWFFTRQVKFVVFVIPFANNWVPAGSKLSTMRLDVYHFIAFPFSNHSYLKELYGSLMEKHGSRTELLADITSCLFGM